MEFQKEHVFTAAKADELKIGSKVICANTLESLKYKVNKECDVTEVKEILKGDNERRFRTEFKGLWPLVYLISEPEEKKLKWTDLKIGDIVKEKQSNRQGMVTGIDPDCSDHIYISGCGVWFNADDLEDWEKVE